MLSMEAVTHQDQDYSGLEEYQIDFDVDAGPEGFDLQIDSANDGNDSALTTAESLEGHPPPEFEIGYEDDDMDTAEPITSNNPNSVNTAVTSSGDDVEAGVPHHESDHEDEIGYDDVPLSTDDTGGNISETATHADASLGQDAVEHDQTLNQSSDLIVTEDSVALDAAEGDEVSHSTGHESTGAGSNTPADDDIDSASVPNIHVMWNHFRYTLFGTQDDDEQTYFLSDITELDSLLSHFLRCLRGVLVNEIAPSDEILIRIPQLALEFGENSHSKFLHRTFREILDCYNQLAENEGITHMPLILHLEARRDCEERLLELLHGAEQGKGLSDMVKEDVHGKPTASDYSDDSVEVEDSSADSVHESRVDPVELQGALAYFAEFGGGEHAESTINDQPHPGVEDIGDENHDLLETEGVTEVESNEIGYNNPDLAEESKDNYDDGISVKSPEQLEALDTEGMTGRAAGIAETIMSEALEQLDSQGYANGAINAEEAGDADQISRMDQPDPVLEVGDESQVGVEEAESTNGKSPVFFSTSAFHEEKTTPRISKRKWDDAMEEENLLAWLNSLDDEDQMSCNTCVALGAKQPVSPSTEEPVSKKIKVDTVEGDAIRLFDYSDDESIFPSKSSIRSKGPASPLSEPVVEEAVESRVTAGGGEALIDYSDDELLPSIPASHSMISSLQSRVSSSSGICLAMPHHGVDDSTNDTDPGVNMFTPSHTSGCGQHGWQTDSPGEAPAADKPLDHLGNLAAACRASVTHLHDHSLSDASISFSIVKDANLPYDQDRIVDYAIGPEPTTFDTVHETDVDDGPEGKNADAPSEHAGDLSVDWEDAGLQRNISDIEQRDHDPSNKVNQDDATYATVQTVSNQTSASSTVDGEQLDYPGQQAHFDSDEQKNLKARDEPIWDDHELELNTHHDEKNEVDEIDWDDDGDYVETSEPKSAALTPSSSAGKRSRKVDDLEGLVDESDNKRRRT